VDDYIYDGTIFIAPIFFLNWKNTHRSFGNQKVSSSESDSSNSFRSSDLGVMGPARYHCAMLLCAPCCCAWKGTISSHGSFLLDKEIIEIEASILSSPQLWKLLTHIAQSQKEIMSTTAHLKKGYKFKIDHLQLLQHVHQPHY
jgi:hypothetical protein